MRDMTRRKALIGLSALTLVLAGCGGGGDGGEAADPAADSSLSRAGAMADFGVNQQFKATEPLEFEVLYNNHSFYPNKNDWLFWEELTKRTNVKIKPIEVPLSDYEQKRGLLVGSGQAPLIIPKTYPGQEDTFVSSGAILPVRDRKSTRL